MDRDTTPNRHKRRLRFVSQGAALGLVAVALGFAAQDAADRLSGANTPAVRSSLRRTVVSSAPYAHALELAGSGPVRRALSGEPRVTLEAFAAEDDAGETRVRLSLRLETPTDRARLEVDATWRRGAERWSERFWLLRDDAPALELSAPAE